MCNFGGSSTNTNQIIRGRRDPNRERLTKPETDLATDINDPTLTKVAKPKTNRTSVTTSDNYKG